MITRLTRAPFILESEQHSDREGQWRGHKPASGRSRMKWPENDERLGERREGAEK